MIELNHIPYENTPSGGYHLYFRSKECEGNRKIAQIRFNNKIDTIIETRGEGGYVVSSPSTGYKILYGDLTSIPTLNRADRKYIFDICRSFDEMEKEAKEEEENGSDLSTQKLLVKLVHLAKLKNLSRKATKLLT